MHFSNEMIENGELCKKFSVLEFRNFVGDVGEGLAVYGYIEFEELRSKDALTC